MPLDSAASSGAVPPRSAGAVLAPEHGIDGDRDRAAPAERELDLHCVAERIRTHRPDPEVERARRAGNRHVARSRGGIAGIARRIQLVAVERAVAIAIDAHPM